jgi:hypothetical protein
MRDVVEVGTRWTRVSEGVVWVRSAVPGPVEGCSTGVGHGGRGAGDGVEEGGARWIGSWMDVAEGAATMDALGDSSAMASAAVLL